MLTVRQVAARLNVSMASVFKLVARGELPHVRVLNAIRISEGDVRAWLERQRR